MLATLEQPTNATTPTTATLPTVTYDLEDFQINATVIASFDSQPLIPSICVPGPFCQLWTLTWTVVAIDGSKVTGFSVEVPKEGLHLPYGIELGNLLGSEVAPSLPITNRVEVINSVAYDVILGLSSNGERANFATKDRTITIDPTIVVTLDPMG